MVLSKKQGPKRARSRERHTMYQRRPPNSSGSDVMDEKDAVGVVTVTQALLFLGSLLTPPVGEPRPTLTRRGGKRVRVAERKRKTRVDRDRDQTLPYRSQVQATRVRDELAVEGEGGREPLLIGSKQRFYSAPLIPGVDLNTLLDRDCCQCCDRCRIFVLIFSMIDDPAPRSWGKSSASQTGSSCPARNPTGTSVGCRYTTGSANQTLHPMTGGDREMVLASHTIPEEG
jgi:hypothetical protein